jgi:hypothetical protein
MKSGASDRLWRPICKSYRSPLEVGNVEFLVSGEDCAIITGETLQYSKRRTTKTASSKGGDLFGEVDKSLVSSRSTAAAVQPRFDFRSATLIDRSSSLSVWLACSSCD